MIQGKAFWSLSVNNLRMQKPSLHEAWWENTLSHSSVPEQTQLCKSHLTARLPGHLPRGVGVLNPISFAFLPGGCRNGSSTPFLWWSGEINCGLLLRIPSLFAHQSRHLTHMLFRLHDLHSNPNCYLPFLGEEIQVGDEGIGRRSWYLPLTYLSCILYLFNEAHYLENYVKHCNRKIKLITK